MRILDTPHATTHHLPCLVQAGVHAVIRYYNFRNSRSLPTKRVERLEALALTAHGLLLGVVFQQRQDRCEDFTAAQGVLAGQRAYRYAQESLGQPAGSAIYFAVDWDASATDIRRNILPYFRGIQQAWREASDGTPAYQVGVYGSGLVCTTLTTAGLSTLTWLAMSRGFRGTRTALAAGAYHLAQRAPATMLCGLGVDENEVNPARPDWGGFLVQEA